MLRSYLSPVARRVGQLEALRATTGRGRWSPKEQAQICRNFLFACGGGGVERTPQGYLAITDNRTYGQPFEIEPGRWEKRCKIIPELAEMNTAIAQLLTDLLQRTGKHFPVDEGLGAQPGPELVAAIYRHYGARIFDE